MKKKIKYKNNLVKQQPTNQGIAKDASQNTNEETSQYEYSKRSGTSGISGQLYETKLLSLLLIRAINDKDIRSFSLETNVADIGDLDDIVFRYKLHGTERSRAIFVQAKHRENPEKEKVTVSEVLNKDSDFSLYKYLDSYLKIKYKFKPNNHNPVFQGNFKDVDCDFIIYTPAVENFNAQKPKDENTTSKAYLMKANKTGKVFHIDYDKLGKDNIDTLIKTIRITRIKLLAKRFVKLVMKDNCMNMMNDDLIKTYHVFLSENVIKLSNAIIPNDLFVTYEFRENFFSSDDYLLTILRESILKETLSSFSNKINLNADKVLTTEEIINHLKLLPDKVPKEFGNQDFHVVGDQKRERRLNYITRRLKKLIESADSSTNIVYIDDSMMGSDTNSIFMEADIKHFKIGGLVGNLLVLDEKLNMLKLNPQVINLSDDAIEVYKKLKEETKLNDQLLIKYRFDVNVHCFPRLTIYKEEHDTQLLKKILDNLTFYTNQAQENDVEEIVKDEIEKLCYTQDDLMFRIKRDAIFLEAHDKIQQWWKKKVSAPDLNKDCKYFIDAKKKILSNPLLSILNVLYTKQINKFSIQFHATATETLHFISETKENIVNIISTEQITLTSMKLLQYFKNNCSGSSYLFVDFDFVIKEDFFQLFISELKELNTDNLIIVSKEPNNIKYFNEKLKSILNTVSKNVVIITYSSFAHEIMLTNPAKFRHEPDNRNGLSDLDFEFSNTIELLEKNIVFQGKEVSLNDIVNKEIYRFVNAEVLYKVMNGEKINIGRILTNALYSEIKSYYENQDIWRCINLKLDKPRQEVFNIIKSDEVVNIQENKDIILLSNTDEKFKNLCDKYKHSFNIHWFVPEGNNHLWRQTNGSLKNILRYVERPFNSSYLQEMKTVMDINEGIIIIGAEAGMGKSTFLNELATKSKEKYPSLWIANINLLDYADEFERWYENEIDIVTEADLFLCRALCVQPFKYKEEHAKLDKKVKIISNDILELDTTKTGTNIRVKSNSGHYNSGVTLFELELFNYYYNKGEIAVLFDGFDEICPNYNKEVIQLIEILKRKIKYIWMTTRPYNFILNQLEEKFGVFSYNLQLWSIPKQSSFLMKYFIKNLEIDTRDSKNINHLKSCCDDFLKNIHLSMNDNKQNNKFTEIPLHIYMIAEIFQDSFINYYKTGVQKLSYKYKKEIENLNLITLYERFAEIKFNIHFVEKNPSDSSSKPVAKKRLQDDRDFFLNYHKMIAAYTLFDKKFEELFSVKDKKKIDKLIETAKEGDEKTGIINEFIGNEPKFVHFTFAEYFATEFLCDQLLSDSCTEAMWIYLVDNVLTNGNEGVKKFFNSKLATKGPNSLIYSNEFYSNEHLIAILNQMFIQTKEYMGDTALHIAIEESLENIATFLLKAMKIVLNETNLDKFIKIIIHRNTKRCVFCAAVTKELNSIIGVLLSCITDLNRSKLLKIFKCEDAPNNPFIEALAKTDKDVENKTELIDFILTTVKDNNDVFELFARPYPPVNAIQFLINRDKSWINIILKHLNKLKKKQRWKLFSAQDDLGRTPAHYAMSANDIKFYSIMKSLLDSEQFDKICSTPDFNGVTPMRLPITNLLFNVGAALEHVNPFPNMSPDDFLRNILGKEPF